MPRPREPRLTLRAISKLLENEPKEDIQAALVALKSEYDQPGGLSLVEVAGGFQIVTRSDLHEWVRRLFNERSTQKLTVQALESLAVIAYPGSRSPRSKSSEVRGVNTSGVLTHAPRAASDQDRREKNRSWAARSSMAPPRNS